MHSILFCIVVVCLVAAELCIGLSTVPADLMVVCMAIAICVIGLPHGADDQRAGLQIMDRLLAPSESQLWSRWIRSLLFFSLYVSVAAAVVAGWYGMPMATVLIFFALSSWHFGSEDQLPTLHRTALRIPLIIACGGMVIWVPILFQAEAVESLLRVIIPDYAHNFEYSYLTLPSLMQSLKMLSIACLVIWFLGLCMSSWSSPATASWRIRSVLLFALLASTSPLVGFTVYFCVWHSIRELLRFKEQYGTAAIARLVPMTLAAIGLFATGFCIWQWTGVQAWSENLIRTIFIGLSAVAIPHLLLHFFEHQMQGIAMSKQMVEAQ